MSGETVNVPPYATPLVDKGGRLTSPWQWWFAQMYDRSGGTVDKVDAAATTAAAAVPQTTQVVAGGGLQVGGALSGNVGLSLYRAKGALSSLPTSGNSEGDWAYALNGRKSGETTGNGTGVPCFWSTPGGTGGWYRADGTAVAT